MSKSRAKQEKLPSMQPQKITLSVPRLPGETHESAAARAMLRPDVQAGMTLFCYEREQPGVSLDGLVSELSAQCEAATKGDLARSEALLAAQAHTLDAIFNSLARRAERTEYLKQFEAYLRLALKAQSQCRATLETLAVIKNPRPIAFVTQANIAHGPQQVNNTVPETAREQAASALPSRTRESENEQNKLLEHTNGERLDTRAAAPAISADTPLEAVGERHRPENRRR